MLKKFLIWIWFAEVLPEQEIVPIEETREYRNQKRLEELWMAQPIVEEKPKERKKFQMFKDSEKEKEQWKNYFRNLIDWYERTKWKKFINENFIDKMPNKNEKFHWFLLWTHVIKEISRKVEIAENKKLKQSLYSNKKHD